MSHEPVAHRPGHLYALRLLPAQPRGAVTAMQGEVEHVVTGERYRFQEASELVAWLQHHTGATACAPPEAAHPHTAR